MSGWVALLSSQDEDRLTLDLWPLGILGRTQQTQGELSHGTEPHCWFWVLQLFLVGQRSSHYWFHHWQ